MERQSVGGGRRASGWAERWPILVRLLDRLQPAEEVVLVATALVIGIGTGLGAIGFIRLIELVEHILYRQSEATFPALGRILIILVPALGGLMAGPIVAIFAPEAKGHGVPEVMAAIATRGGRIRPRVVVGKAVASALTLGSGGSAGREGPIVQIGSALGSTVGQLLRLSDERIRNLVACGAAAGIAAVFNAPIAGVIFAIEVILNEFGIAYFGTVVLSAVTASIVSRAFLGNTPAFVVPTYAVNSVWEFPLYAILGVLAALVAMSFVITLGRFEDGFDGWKFPDWLKPAVGGLLLGLIGFVYPYVMRATVAPSESALLQVPVIDHWPRFFGAGFGTIEEALQGNGTVALLAALVILKLLATSLTLGSGSSGGIFAPSLFMGAVLGGAFGHTMQGLFPSLGIAPGAFAVVGMASVFSGAAHAPLSAILIVFEMTNDYRIILPLMLATVISTLLTRGLYRESIYTIKLLRRGIHLVRGRDIDVMQGITVGEVMTTTHESVNDGMTVRELADLFSTTHHHGFPVVDGQGELTGIVTIQDLERSTEQGRPPGAKVSDIMTTDLLVAYPDEPVWSALKRMGARDVGRLPVVERRGSKKLMGIIRRADIVRAYNVAMARRVELEHRSARLRLGKVSGTEFVEMAVPIGSSLAGQPVKAVPLPRECVLVSIRRGRGIVLPHGNTVLQAGDRVTALVDSDYLDDFRRLFAEGVAKTVQSQQG